MEEIVYLNGAFLPLSKAKISIADYGFLFGYGLYETMRTYDGNFFRLDEHLKRFQRSTEALEIQVDVSEIGKAVLETVHCNGLKSARVRITVTPGEGSLTPDPDACREPTILITATRYTPYPAGTYEKGLRAIISSAHRNSQSELPAMKTTCFLESILARKQARAAGADDALLLNDKGMLAEASSSNIFLVRKSILQTPKPGSGLLPGITRDVILELAPLSGVKALETDIHPDELMEADEAFLTNSMIELMPLIEVNGEKIGPGKPGSVTRQLLAAYREQVTKESHSQ
jgi:branched-chain amino acid aminotransferase